MDGRYLLYTRMDMSILSSFPTFFSLRESFVTFTATSFILTRRTYCLWSSVPIHLKSLETCFLTLKRFQLPVNCFKGKLIRGTASASHCLRRIVCSTVLYAWTLWIWTVAQCYTFYIRIRSSMQLALWIPSILNSLGRCSCAYGSLCTSDTRTSYPSIRAPNTVLLNGRISARFWD